MAYNKVFSNLSNDLHTVLCKYKRNAIFTLSKDQLIKYKWSYLIKSIFKVNYNLPVNEMMKIYNSFNKSIFGGVQHVIIKLNDGRLFACGTNHEGQLGLGSTFTYTLNKSVEITKIPRNIVEVACGGNHTIIRLSDGTLMATGKNNHGQLGLGTRCNQYIFKKITKVPKNVVQIACGKNYTIIRLSDGTLMGTGDNENGQLGKVISNGFFNKIKNAPKGIIDVVCGYYHTVVKLKNNKLMGCGKNHLGQLSIDVDDYNTFNFKEIMHYGHDDNSKDIICSKKTTILKRVNQSFRDPSNYKKKLIGSLFFIAGTDSGQLGSEEMYEGGEYLESIPENTVDMYCGSRHTVIKLSDGTLLGVGSNLEGQLGMLDKYDEKEFKKLVNLPKNVTEILCGETYTIVKSKDGLVYGCGRLAIDFKGDRKFNTTRFTKIRIDI